MPQKIAFLFPGQGSQSIGMGWDIINHIPGTEEIFEQVDEICGKSISKLCLEGPMGELTLTVNLQPAITAINLICLRALRSKGIQPSVSAGHSVGEFSALSSAGVINEYDALRIIKKRGELMHRESISHPGIMKAILKLDLDKVEEIVAKAGNKGIVAIANHNTAQQVVITGEKEPVEYAEILAKELGGKVIALPVSGPWHCNLMKGAVRELRDFMEDIPFSRPKSTVLFNATACEENDPEKIKDIMAQQMVSPVQWYDTILRMQEEQITSYVEVGPKKVLTGTVNRTIPKNSAGIFNVEDRESLNTFLKALK
jgi:[acyl-carrier-protein] S-malonyltransferase